MPAVLLGCLLAGTLTACTSGDGGDNGGAGNPDTGADVGAVNPDQPAGLAFSYPVNGQTDVYPGTTIAFAFNGDASGSVQLVDTQSGKVLPASVVNRGNGIFNVYPADSDAQMAPATTYAVVAQGAIGDGDNTQFANGDTLFAFTTAAAGGASTSSDFTLVNFPSGTDAGFPINGESFPFTQFNTLRARFSQPVDEGSVKLCTGSEALGDSNCTVAVTGPDGSNVAGRLSVLGKNFVFDPGSISPNPTNQDADQYDGDDLAANVKYTVSFDDDFISASGNSLSGTDSFSVTPLGINTGNRVDVVQRVRIGPTNDNGISPLTGQTADVIQLASQLIGSYNLAAFPSRDQGLGLQVRLAAFNGERFGGKIPTLLPRGQRFILQDFNLSLGSQLNDNGTFTDGQIDTPVNLDALNAQFANDSDIYLLANNLSNVETPTRVAQRVDLNIFGQVAPNSPIAALSNGVVNQTALNVLASGIAVPQDNGDIALALYGSFPIKVNRDGEAAVNFELELTLPAAADDQPTIVADRSAPFITGQYPSACSFTFGLEDFPTTSQLTRVSQPEADCVEYIQGNNFGFPRAYEQFVALSNAAAPTADLPNEEDFFRSLSDLVTTAASQPFINSTSPESELEIVFDEPIDPASARNSFSLYQNDENLVATRIRAEGSSVIIAPIDGLKPGTYYEIRVSGSAADLSGNELTFSDYNVPINFETQPIVAGNEDVVRQIAPFVTAISTGLPCALANGDFMSGGSVAGRCVNDLGGDSSFSEVFDTLLSPVVTYDVFRNPSNRAITSTFSKEVRANSIVLSTSCLTGAAGNDGSDSATVALQKVDSDGNCEGAVSGTVSFNGTRTDESGQVLVNGMQFNPSKALEVGQRYWFVMCGSENPNPVFIAESPAPTSSNGCASGATIRGREGYALNTNPLRGIGTRATGTSFTADGVQQIFTADRGDGGPDLIVPFDATEATANYSSIFRAFPAADTNGNGFFENEPAFGSEPTPELPIIPGGFVTGITSVQSGPFDDSLGRENPQPENRLLSQTSIAFQPGQQRLPANTNIAYLSSDLPITVLEVKNGGSCGEVDELANNSVFESVSGNTCLPVEISPGALSYVTSFKAANLASIGATLLRFPGVDDVEGRQAQLGYIVNSCEGSLNGEEFDYSPCFVAKIKVTANFPGTLVEGQTSFFLLKLLQQDFDISLVGPVSFQQNGKLTISTTNTKTFQIRGQVGANGGSSVTSVEPGQQTLQLVGSAIHGGKAFPGL